MSIKNKIVEGINTAKEQLGITLVTEDWGSKKTKCACALGCVLLANNHGLTDDAEQNATEAAELLGVSESWIDNFIRGFDGDSPDEDEPEEAYEIGQELLKTFKPTSHSDYVEGLDSMAVEFMQSVDEVQ